MRIIGIFIVYGSFVTILVLSFYNRAVRFKKFLLGLTSLFFGVIVFSLLGEFSIIEGIKPTIVRDSIGIIYLLFSMASIFIFYKYIANKRILLCFLVLMIVFVYPSFYTIQPVDCLAGCIGYYGLPFNSFVFHGSGIMLPNEPGRGTEIIYKNLILDTVIWLCVALTLSKVTKKIS